jgi:MFS transporter, SP family, general alpha glucoside:H+ symporter
MADTEKAEFLVVEDDLRKNINNTLYDAIEETNVEHEMTLWQGMKLYPKAITWSFLISLSVIMEGYDTALLGNFFAYPTFQKKYGQPFDGGYELAARWQTSLGLASGVGSMFGVLISGYITDLYGHKRIMQASLIAITGFIFITFFAPNATVLLVGEILCGLPWGAFATVAPAYAAEVCPVVLRGYLTAYINLCWVIGQLLASGVLRGFVNRTDEWGYRIPFALQWMWPVPLFIVVTFAPESPWSLVRRGKLQEAEISVRRLASKSEQIDEKRTVAFMVHTTELERKVSEGTTYFDLFKGSDGRRTEIACMVFLSSTMCAGNVLSYANQFFETAGFSATNAFNLGVGQNAIGFVGTVLSWFAITYFGRRALYLSGFIMLGTVFFILGCISFSKTQGALWTQAAMIFVAQFIFEFNICPLCWMLISEISSTRLRAKTISLSRDVYQVWAILNAVVYPFIMNPTADNWKGKVGFLQTGYCALCALWTFFRLPEIKGRTYGELDFMFQKGVPTREFKNYVVDLSETSEDMHGE